MGQRRKRLAAFAENQERLEVTGFSYAVLMDHCNIKLIYSAFSCVQYLARETKSGCGLA
jgi:hypothetical protein